MAATTFCNATPPAQQCAAYIWFGNLKDGCHYAMPRHLHNKAQHIFGLENLKDGRHYSCNATPPAHGKLAYIWLGKLKRWLQLHNIT
jgi:hypothetical protein